MKKNKGILTRLQDFLISRRPSVSFGHERDSGLFDMIQKEGHRLLSQNPRMQWIRKHPRDLEMDREDDWFRFVNDVSESIIQNKEMENRSFDKAFLQTWQLYKKKPGSENISFRQILDLAS